jgi:hypothetical protein
MLIGLSLVLIGAADSTVRLLIPVGLVLAAGIGTAYWSYSLRPAIRLDDSSVTVINPWRRTSVPLTSVLRVAPGYSGINIEYLIGNRPGVVCAWAVQKANLSTWRGRQTRADRVAEAIKRRARLIDPGASAD